MLLFAANFGGIFGLCLGASLVSAVELLYYGTFGFGLYLYDNEYFMVFKANLRKWATALKNSFKYECEIRPVVKASATLHNFAMHKNNRW